MHFGILIFSTVGVVKKTNWKFGKQLLQLKSASKLASPCLLRDQSALHIIA